MLHVLDSDCRRKEKGKKKENKLKKKLIKNNNFQCSHCPSSFSWKRHSDLYKNQNQKIKTNSDCSPCWWREAAHVDVHEAQVVWGGPGRVLGLQGASLHHGHVLLCQVWAGGRSMFFLITRTHRWTLPVCNCNVESVKGADKWCGSAVRL